MGIYYGDKIYGIKIVNKSYVVLFLKTYNEGMTDEDKLEAKNTYLQLLSENNNNYDHVSMFGYIDVTTTYDYPPSTERCWIHSVRASILDGDMYGPSFIDDD